jgi:CheY-like chemotaxis protein
LIDDLLDLTRIARGKLALELQPRDAHAILQDALATVRVELAEKQIGLKLNLAADRSVVLGDDVRLQQVFWNVLKNAVKFTPQGGQITIETRTRAESGHVTVEVTDTGIGMTTVELERAFDAFSQGDHAESGGSHRFGGIGLGLTISRMLVELQKGTIRASSAGRGYGSTFVIEFPLASTEEGKDDAAPVREIPPSVPLAREARGSARRRVLLVEDHEPTRATLALLLNRRSFDVVTAGCLAEARTLAEQGEFDLLISDIGLPDGSGYDLMTNLRDRRGLKGIALSGYGMEQDIARSQAAGFVAHLTKPVRVKSLESALAAAGS